MGTMKQGLVTVGVIAALAAAFVACSNDGGTPTPSPRTSSPPSTTTAPAPTTDLASAVLLTDYQSYWKARVEAQAHPTEPLPKALTQYGQGQAVTDVRATVLLFRQQGIEMRGEPALAPEVEDLTASTASITDCVDSTNWKPVYAATGKSALAPNQATRVVLTATAVKGAGTWQITTATVQRDRTC